MMIDIKRQSRLKFAIPDWAYIKFSNPQKFMFPTHWDIYDSSGQQMKHNQLSCDIGCDTTQQAKLTRPEEF